MRENIDIKMFFVLLATPFIILSIQIILFKMRPRSSPQVLTIKSIIIGFLPSFSLIWIFVYYGKYTPLSSKIWGCIYCFIVYSAFGYSYFHFFNMSETARRIRIMHEINHASILTEEEIINKYQISNIVNNRFQRLIELKQIRLLDGSYSINKKYLYYAAIILNYWRRLLRF